MYAGRVERAGEDAKTGGFAGNNLKRKEVKMGNVSFNEIARQAMAEIIKKALGDENEIRNFIHSNLQSLLEEFLNTFMIAERRFFLNTHDDVANGFRHKKLGTPLGNLSIRVPRTRYLNFRPSIIAKPYRRTDPSYTHLLEALIASGYSPERLKEILRMLGLSYSHKEVQTITEQLKDRYYHFIHREIPEDMFCLYVDAYRAQMKDDQTNTVRLATIYTIIGVDLQWKKSLLGFYTLKGNENKTS